jgi:glycosyltransferase involved in cell wall biosynthesis
MKQKIRILEIINHAVIGGGPGHIFQILRGIDADHFQVAVACTPEGGDLPRFRKFSAAYFPVPIGKIFRLKTIRQLRKIIRLGQIQIVHTHGGVAGLWGRLAAWGIRNVAVVHTLHGIHFLNYPNPLIKWLYIQIERALSRITDRTICVAQADFKKALENRLFVPEKGTVIRNGIDFSVFRLQPTEIAELKNSLGISLNAVVIGQVARLHAQKGQKYLLEAFARVRQNYPLAQLLLIGDGPAKTELQRLAKKLKISDSVHFAGFRTEIGNLLQLMDIFVLSSLWEGLPLALLEALSQGLPVVATAVDGIPEIISSDADGLLVAPADSTALADGILRLLSHPEQVTRFRETGPEKIKSQFSEKNMLQALENLYLNLVEN